MKSENLKRLNCGHGEERRRYNGKVLKKFCKGTLPEILKKRIRNWLRHSMLRDWILRDWILRNAIECVIVKRGPSQIYEVGRKTIKTDIL